MRKIIESTLVSADGVVGSPPLWATDYRDEEVTRDALERLSGSDAMLMGRGTYELFAATWTAAVHHRRQDAADLGLRQDFHDRRRGPVLSDGWSLT